MQLSVVVPTYNRPTTLGKTLASLEKQSFNLFELIVCDDASAIKYSEPLVNALKHPDNLTKLIRQETNKGEVENVFTGIHLAQGEYVYILHDDDTLTDVYAFTECLHYLQKYKPTLLVCAHQVTTKSGYGPVYMPFDGDFTEAFQKIILEKNPTIVGGFFVRKDALEAVGYLDARYKYYSDWDLLIRLSTLDNFKAYYFRHVIVNYNRHTASQTDKLEKDPETKQRELGYIKELATQIKQAKQEEPAGPATD